MPILGCRGDPFRDGIFNALEGKVGGHRNEPHLGGENFGWGHEVLSLGGRVSLEGDLDIGNGGRFAVEGFTCFLGGEEGTVGGGGFGAEGVQGIA